jgi:hypothetical protein
MRNRNYFFLFFFICNIYLFYSFLLNEFKIYLNLFKRIIYGSFKKYNWYEFMSDNNLLINRLRK